MIEKHSETLSRGWEAEIRKSNRTSDFRKIPPGELKLAATEVCRKLGEWRLPKTEADMARRFKVIAQQRAAEGISLHQFVWALTLARDHLWHFLRREAFADTVIELHGELELLRLLNQFFDRVLYYPIVGYEMPEQPSPPTNELLSAQGISQSPSA